MVISLLKTSLFMSVTIAGLALLAQIFNRPALARLRYVCWMVVVLGLLIPFRLPVVPIEQPAVLTQIADFASENVPTSVSSAADPSGYNIFDIFDNARRQAESELSDGTAARNAAPISYGTLLFIGWAVGFVSFAVVCVYRHRRFIQHIKRWASFERDERIEGLLAEARHVVGLKRKAAICVCGTMDTPIVTGFIHPLVILPQTSADDETLLLMLTHELIHFKRGDIWVRTLMLAAWAVHWFNPLLFVMSKLMNRDCEISCDQSVIRHFGTEHRTKYGQAVFDTAYNAAGAGKNRAVISPAFSDNARYLKVRLSSIIEGKGMKRWVAVCCTVVLLSSTLFTVMLTGYATDNPTAPDIADGPVDLSPTSELVLHIPFLTENYIVPLVERYKAMYPDVNVITEIVGGWEDLSGYAIHTSVELSSGTGPDIIFPSLLWHSDVNKLANNGTFLDLKNIVESDPSFNMDDYIEPVFDGGFFRGRQYLIPLSFTLSVYVSSAQKLDEIGFDASKTNTMTAFINELARCAPKASSNPYYERMIGRSNALYALMVPSGIDLADFKYDKALPDEAALKRFLEAYKLYYPYDLPEGESADTYVALQTGRRFFEEANDMRQWFEYASMLKDNGGYKTTVLRCMDGQVQGMSMNTVAIRSGSTNQLNAWNFIKLLLSAEGQMPMGGRFDLVGYPVLKEAVAVVAETENGKLEKPLSDAEKQELIDMVFSVEVCNIYPNQKTGLVTKYMEPWFKGEKDYGECVKELKNELYLYITE